MAMNYTKEGLARLGDDDLAQIIAGVHVAFKKRHPKMEDIPLRRPEQLGSVDRFTEREKKALLKDRAVVLTLLKPTITLQREYQGQKGKPSFRYVVPAEDGLLDVSSRVAEVAVYPDPDKFFIPGTGGKDIPTMERLASEDGQALRERLGLVSGIDVRIPEEASTLTGVTFEYLDQTGEWLFGPGYGYRYGITKNPTTKSGSLVAVVGSADPDDGLDVLGMDADNGYDIVHAVRLVVPDHGTKQLVTW